MDPQQFGTPQNPENIPTDEQPIPASVHQPAQVFGTPATPTAPTPQESGVPVPSPFTTQPAPVTPQNPAAYPETPAQPQPAQPASMPTPVANPAIFSANSKPPKEPRSKGKLLKQISLIGGLLAILLVIWLGFQYFTGYSTKTLTNGGYQYQFTFANNAKTVSINGKNYLQGKAQHSLNTLKVIAEPTTDSYISSCGDVGSSWNSSFDVTLSGERYLVCTVNNHSVYMTIVGHRSDSSHHMVEVSSQDGNSAISQDAAKALLSSIDISQP